MSEMAMAMQSSVERINSMFARISPTYDKVNTILSFGLDHQWRKSVLKELPRIQGTILDCCAGTGELAILMAKHGYQVTATDLCLPMLEEAVKKVRRGNFATFVEANCLNLPFQDNSFDAVTNAFSLRNLPDLTKAFSESHRVLISGGKGIFLELTRPANWLKIFHHTYLNTVLPFLGGLISNDREAYSYLSRSIINFPSSREIADLLRTAGFKDIGTRTLSGGIATLWSGIKG